MLRNFKTKITNFKNKIKELKNKIPQMPEKAKNITILVLKILLVCVFAGVYSVFWSQGLYKVDNSIYWRRVIEVTAIFLIPALLLFFKIRIPNKLNLVVSVLFSIFVMRENYVMLAKAQGYKWDNIGVQYQDMNMIIIFMIFIVFFAIFNSFKAGIIGLNIVTVVLGVTNYFLCMFRGTGFLAADILSVKTAANVAEGYTYTLDFNIFFLILTLFAICLLALKLGKNTLTPKFWRIVPIIIAICVVSHCYTMYIDTDEFDATLKIKYYKPQETFEKKGLYLTFAHSIKDLMVDPPKGYSVKAVEKLADENKATEATVSKDKQPNIIMIMDEAFTDFSSFTNLKINKDCMPYFHSLKDNTVKGQMFVSIFGGGTASTEFEAQTSNTMAFIPNGITAYTTYINSPMPSLTTILNSQNYGGLIAMHPYNGTGYKRNKVYPLLGFNKFITNDDFNADTVDRVRKWISDKGDFDRIISEYKNYKKNNSANPFYMFNVTMQNHSPFDTDFDNLYKDYKTEYGIDVPQADRYMNLMKHTDEALKELIEYFKKVDEPTIIVFYGDHQPKIEEEFYDRVSKGYNLDDVYKNFKKYNTQFVLWANYDIEEKDDVYMSANYMSSLILDTAGLAKSGYETLVSKVREQIPIITKHGYIGKNGKFYEVDDTTSPYYNILQQYNIAQYNNIFDTKNRVDSFFTVK